MDTFSIRERSRMVALTLGVIAVAFAPVALALRPLYL